jgi:predicted GNAT family acetyltransferase
MTSTTVRTGVLQRPIWHALTTRQNGLAAGTPRARRFPHDVSPFAATAQDDPASLADLAPLAVPGQALLFLQEGPIPTPPGFVEEFRGPGVQMTATRIDPPDSSTDVLELGEDDAADMLALATLTRPGPFLSRTNTLGAFVGIRDESGRLVAMAGERLRVEGHTEVSGVCTHPQARGHGHAALLSGIVAGRILDRGETPFLHAIATNRTAIDLYTRLGFVVSRDISVAAFRRP